MHTPWGKAQKIKTISKGFRFVVADKQAGFMISNGLAKKELSDIAQTKGIPYGNYLFFEKTQHWAIPMYESTEFFNLCLDFFQKDTETLQQMMFHSLSLWHGDYLLQKGVTPEPTRYERFLQRQQHVS